MKSIKFKKITAAVIAIATVVSVLPISASAAWKENSNNTWVYTEGESVATGWKMIDGTWYHFDDSGNMQTGWINDGGTWYYTGSDGSMKTGWVNDNGSWYYTETSGAMKSGWVNDNGIWYCLDSSGAMKTGWINDNGTWYYTASNGVMQSGVVEVDNKVYLLSTNGAMQSGNVEINGQTYTFAPTGECVGENKPQPIKGFNKTGDQTAIKTPTNDTSKTEKDNTSNTKEDKSSSGSKHHDSSSSSDSDKDMSKLTIKNDEISFDYKMNKNINYDIQCEIYDKENNSVDTIKWEDADNVNNSKGSIFISDVIGEMKENNYIVSKIMSKGENKTALKSNKMEVASRIKMNKDTSQFDINMDKTKKSSKITIKDKENFEAGTYVLYGYENDNSAYVKTIYCPGNTKTLEFSNLKSAWINSKISKLKVARIYDVQQTSNGSGTCKVEYTDEFSF